MSTTSPCWTWSGWWRTRRIGRTATCAAQTTPPSGSSSRPGGPELCRGAPPGSCWRSFAPRWSTLRIWTTGDLIGFRPFLRRYVSEDVLLWLVAAEELSSRLVKKSGKLLELNLLFADSGFSLQDKAVRTERFLVDSWFKCWKTQRQPVFRLHSEATRF